VYLLVTVGVALVADTSNQRNRSNNMLTQMVVDSMLYHKVVLPARSATRHVFFKVIESRNIKVSTPVSK
jgi:hypothetical protein